MSHISVGEPFNVALVSGIAKIWIKKGVGAEYQDVLSNTSCLAVPKIFVGKPFSVSLISGTEKKLDRRGGYQDFPSIIFCPTVSKFSVGETFKVALVSGFEKIWIREGGRSIKMFCRTLLVSQCRKFSQENPLVFH